MTKAASFEENLDKLHKIVEDLEKGELSLKDSLEKFQEGVDIIEQCHKELESAEMKIENITKKEGKIIIEPSNEK